jgi:hypothetical protein
MALLTQRPSEQSLREFRQLGTRAARGLGQAFGNPNQFLTNQERAQDQLQGLMNRPADLSSVEGYTNFLKLQLQANPQNQAAILQAGLPQLRALRKEQADSNRRKQQQTAVSTFFADKPNLKILADSGIINPTNFDKFVKLNKDVEPTNVQYLDTNGEYVTELVFIAKDGTTLDEKGQPVELPANARLETVGRTPQDLQQNQLGLPVTDDLKKKISGEVLGNVQRIDTLSGLLEENAAEFASIKGKVKTEVGKVLSKLEGLGGKKLDAYLQEIITDESLIDRAGKAFNYLSQLEKYFLEKKHDVTGAQAALKEIQDLRRAILSSELTPTEIRANVQQLINREDGELNRLLGFINIDRVDLESWNTEAGREQSSLSIIPEPQSQAEADGAFLLEGMGEQ